MEELNTYAIFVTDDISRMYTIEASYFVASDIGVIFFTNEGEGIGFVPTDALYMVKKIEPDNKKDD